jgi:outer membrane protein assembly factor BamE (lipoprotein component of BamABCDE complex)
MVHSNGTSVLSRLGGPLRGLLMAMVVVIAACSPLYQNHGYVPSDDELALITVGKDTRESVEAAIGRPSASGLLNDVGWFYVQSRWKNYGALASKEIDRQVVAISFADSGVVENIERFGLEKGRIVPISRRVTESNIKSDGFLRQLFGNVGGLSTGQLVK